MKNEQKFYSALEEIFIGEAGRKIEGKSGYVNLMKLKSKYFSNVKEYIKEEVDSLFPKLEERNEAFSKLYTFFESYLNDTGTPYFSNTPFHKNLFEKIYSEKEDISLFWKTQKLYYVKSEANYQSIKNMEIGGIVFNFDASNIEHKKNNEKKTLEFYATDITNTSITFKVLYEDKSKTKWERLKEYLNLTNPDQIRKYIVDNFDNISHSNISIIRNNLNRQGFKHKQLMDSLLIVNNKDDILNSVAVEFAIPKIENIEFYEKLNNLNWPFAVGSLIRKAIQIYKKQNEVDYFIHRDAQNFLKEQFDFFIYQYLFGESHLYNQWNLERIDLIQKIKQLAYKIIDIISRFEDELKAIWEKYKVVRNVDYIITLDRFFPVKNSQGVRDFSDSKGIEILEKILSSKGFEKQIEEYKHLKSEWLDEKGEQNKKEWQEFSQAAALNKFDNDIILNSTIGKRLNESYQFLFIDTKLFPDLKYEILSFFDNFDSAIDGVLIKSENWQALNSLMNKYKDQIGLIYIDPPFNTGDDFAYKDSYQDSTWLTLMCNRLQLARKILNKDGSIYLHLDENANYLGRMLMDYVFGKSNFRREIIWDIQVLSGYKVKGADNNWILGHQSIYFYTKEDSYYYKKLMQPQSLKYLESFNQVDEKGQAYQVAHGRRIYKHEVEKKGKPFGDVWVDLKDIIDCERPFMEVWQELSAVIEKELPMRSIWSDIMSFQQQPTSSERILFDTQKPEKLLERIIKSSVKDTDWVLDYYGGSGTTSNTAQKLGIKHITVEMGEHFDTMIIPRCKRTLLGHETAVSRDSGYKGGGFLKYYQLEQYEETLSLANYNDKWIFEQNSRKNLSQLAYYTFKNSDKLLEAMLIDKENNSVKVHFQSLYPEMDESAIAETISNVSGKRIKNITKKEVIFDDKTSIKFDEMCYSDQVFRDHYKSLLWWRSKGVNS